MQERRYPLLLPGYRRILDPTLALLLLPEGHVASAAAPPPPPWVSPFCILGVGVQDQEQIA